MKTHSFPRWLLVAAVMCAVIPAPRSAPPAAAGGAVVESARGIPIAGEFDVVVVGGSSGAAAAAIAAAESGATVFLMAPRSYLGDDICDTRRLWLEEGETPSTDLARRLFAPPPRKPAPASFKRSPNALDFTYKASLSPSPKHKDTQPPARLKDGIFNSPNTDSVQYDGNVTVTADLGKTAALREARLILFHRPGSDFQAAAVTIRSSVDGKSWTVLSRQPCKPADVEAPFAVAAAVTGVVRHVAFDVTVADGSSRVLLGEIELVGGGPAPAPAADAPSASATASARLTTPMQVKSSLDDALLAAKVNFLFGCYPTEVLRDGDGNLCGVVMANRAGRQAVRAKVVIDATPRAVVARMAGAPFAPWPADLQTFTRIAAGGEPKSGPDFTARRTGQFLAPGGRSGTPASGQVEFIEYTLKVPMRDASFASFAEADQYTRDLVWQTGQLDIAEELFQVPPDPVKGAKSAPATADLASLDPDCFRPAGQPRLYVLGGCADVPRETAAKLLRPLALMDTGARIGKAAAAGAKAAGAVSGAPAVAPAAGFADAASAAAAATGDVKELLSGLRPTYSDLPTVNSPKRALPVLGRYDVVVVGGGTGGAPAGIGAARAGANTLLIEYLSGLGGVGTMGRIIKYYHGYRGGFTAQIDAGVKELGAANYVVGKTEWWRQANRKAGTEIWFGTLGCGAYVEGGVVKGVVVATPHGRGVVLANTVVDSTGNADIAAAAGAECDYTGGDDVGVQGTGLPPLEMGDDYTNTDWSFADDTDPVDFWQHFVVARQKFRGAYDLGQLIDTRERRRIVGDVTITPMDIILERAWPDEMHLAMSNFDSHGFTTHPVFFAMPPDRKGLKVSVPRGALTPRGLDGLFVTGLGASAHRDAMPVIRMQPDVQNQGYACGYAGAMAAKEGTTIRKLDIRKVQGHMVETGILPESALSNRDPAPPSPAQIARAVADVTKVPAGAKSEVDGPVQNREAVALLFAHPALSVPALEKAHASASPASDKLAYAHLLAQLGSPAGADTLREKIRSASGFDKGWNYTGMGQFGRSVSELDSYIISLGRTRDPKGLDVILEKTKQLDASREFSHHRACAMALEALGDRRAAPVLADVLKKPGMTGHSFPTIEAVKAGTGENRTENTPRNNSLRELILARALYRCGDHGGLGEKILRDYARDLRGHYARHATAVLDGRK